MFELLQLKGNLKSSVCNKEWAVKKKNWKTLI